MVHDVGKLRPENAVKLRWLDSVRVLIMDCHLQEALQVQVVVKGVEWQILLACHDVFNGFLLRLTA